METTGTAAIYLRLRKRIAIRPGDTVTLAHAARFFTSSVDEAAIGSLELYSHQPEHGNRFVIDLLQIIQSVREAYPSLVVEAYGDPQVLVIIASDTQKPRVVMLLFAWLILFFGAGIAIMNFHADVSMKEVQIRISELITGRRLEHPLWFQVPYSFGIGLGMILFFNHLFRKRFNEEPNPLEVEMFMYQENVNSYVISDEMNSKNNQTALPENRDG